MATTTNYAWDTPDDTDLVKDGAAAIRTLGSSVDSTVYSLDQDNVKITEFVAKGDLLGASAENTPARLAVGANGTVLTADSAESTGLKWATPAPGKVIQMVNTQTGTSATGTGNIPADNTIPQITEGDQYMSLAITPTSASSILLIDVFAMSAAGNDTIHSAALFQDSTANALASTAGLIAGTDKMYTFAFRHKMTAGTTSATTFKVRIGGNAGTTTFNGRAGGQYFGGTMASSITITEYTP
jgi:hypothetical protein